MGVVYLAEDPVLGRDVAIKAIQLHPGLSETQVGELRQRFETEARAAAKLAHPNLVTIFDAGLEQENLYIAMEFVEGEGLDAMLSGGRSLAPDEISQLAGQLASALDYAHGQGIVHRDIKPANVLVSRFGHAKITDFGVARQAASTLTATGAMIGTPAYMSPEQVTGSPVSGASDQFSLAIMVYELLTGERPFAGEGATTILYKIVHEAPQLPTLLRPDLSAELSAAVLRAMSKGPQERFASCSDFAAAISAGLGVAADPSITAAPLSRPATPAPDAGLSTDPDAATSLDSSSGGTSPVRGSGAGPARAKAAPATPAAAPAPAADADARPLPWAMIGGAALGVLLLVAVWVGMQFRGEDVAPGAPLDPAPVEAAAGVGVSVGAEGADTGAEAGVTASSPATAPAAAPAAAPATYRITSRPSGARVMFDGELLDGPTPVEVQLDTGIEHTVIIEMADHEPVSWRFIASELPAELQDSRQLYFPLRSIETAVAAAETVESNAVAAADDGDPAADEVTVTPVELPPVEPLRIRGSMQPPELLERGESPEFPDWAAQQELQRYVILELVIDREGRIRDARPLQAVHPELEDLAVVAVRSWRFSAATRDGEPIDAYHNVSVQFETPDEDADGSP
jgi:TonB family protein